MKYHSLQQKKISAPISQFAVGRGSAYLHSKNF